MPVHPAPGIPTPAPAGTATSGAPTTPPVDMTAALVAYAVEVGYDIDPDEVSVTTGLRCDLMLAWVLAGNQLIVHRYLRSLLDDPIEVMQTATDEHGISLHADDLADIRALARRLDAHMPILTAAYRNACRDIADTGLGMAWSITEHTGPGEHPT